MDLSETHTLQTQRYTLHQMHELTAKQVSFCNKPLEDFHLNNLHLVHLNLKMQEPRSLCKVALNKFDESTFCSPGQKSNDFYSNDLDPLSLHII